MSVDDVHIAYHTKNPGNRLELYPFPTWTPLFINYVGFISVGQLEDAFLKLKMRREIYMIVIIKRNSLHSKLGQFEAPVSVYPQMLPFITLQFYKGSTSDGSRMQTKGILIHRIIELPT